jgi:hypothetical protein
MPFYPTLTVSTAAAPEHFDGQLSALGSQIPVGQEKIDGTRKGKYSKLNPPLGQT